jgi:Flp pilus assembly protein TadG
MLRSPCRNRRQGSIAPLLAFFSVALFSCIALAIDLGMIIVARTQCQNAADAAALAGTRMLDNKPTSVNNSRDSAEQEAKVQAASNQYLNQYFSKNDVVALDIGLYRYDQSAQRFYSDFVSPKLDGESWTAMRVSVRGNQQAYFSKLFGLTSLNTGATAVAVHRPRDIAFVLDFTGSMKFGTTGNWGTDVSNPPEGGSMNADPIYPKFGHYERYTAYSTDPNNDPTATTPASRPNPLYVTLGFVKSSGELLAPANFTSTTQGGPPCVDDFFTDTSNSSTPTNSAFPVNPANLTKAFVNSVMPTPDSYADQSGMYNGDYWPRKDGQVYTTSTSWDPTSSSGAARNLAELLGWLGVTYLTGYTTTTTPTINPPARSAPMLPSPMTATTAYASNWSNFRDATWETYGYDMDIADYRLRRPATHDPRTVLPSNTTGGVTGQVKVTSGQFKGYSMGPRFYGKTFFMWPPDPRAPVGTDPATAGYVAGDWRRRFFLNRNGGAFHPNSDNDPSTTPSNTGTASETNFESISQELIRNGVGTTLTAASGNFTINYNNVLAWIKSGPQTLPSNLRAGKVVYYTSIPDTVTASGSDTPEVALDKVFWKKYIEYVVASTISDATYDDYDMLAGHEKKGWPEGTTPSIAKTNVYTYGSPAVTDPNRPYINYMENPSRPREHFWFGPLTMMKFLAEAKANWWSGTIHESQCWQLKVAISSVLDDVRNNHPNDYAGLAFFAHSAAYYKTIRSPMSQSWTTAKNALFYPFNLNATASPTSTEEIRPYSSTFASIGTLVNANIPNSNGGTDPNSGFALAYNLLSSSPTVNADPVKRGRRGAAKVVIFETDGVPNAHQMWQFNAYGYESYFTNTGNGTSDGNGSINAMQPAYDIVTQIRKPAASSNTAGTDSGFSTGSSPARVYAIGFGDLFSTPTATQQVNARNFLLNIQKLGGTSSTTASALPTDQIITGDYNTRIENLRAVLERIIQAGVQVTLIE